MERHRYEFPFEELGTMASALEMDLDAAAFDNKHETLRKLLKGVEELHTYVERNQSFIPNYGEPLSQRRKNRFRLRRVGSQSGDQQENEQAATNAVDTARRTFTLAVPDTCAQRRVGGHLSPLVSRLPATNPSAITLKSCLTPSNRMLSIEDLLLDLSLIQAHSMPAKKVADGLAEFETYIRNNCEFIPNFGERYRNGETISTAFVESTINQVVSKRFVKKQSMQWTLRGAHLLLHTQTKVLSDELEEVFRRWYPKFRPQSRGMEAERKAA